MTKTVAALVAGATVFAVAPAADAVMLYRSPVRNTTAPGGAFVNSGWQFQGQFGAFLGTPISSKYFITAAHIGGHTGVPFVLGSNTFTVDPTFNGGSGFANVAGTDLRIWRIQETFTDWAPLYDATLDGAETGKTMVVFGRGTQRGDEVYGRYPSPPRDGPTGGSFEGIPIPNPNQVGELKGWTWGAADAVQAWGTNVVTGAFNGGPGLGHIIYFDFDRNGLFDEAALSGGDSSGGVFIQVGGVWKLAGINLAVDGPWRTSPDGPVINAALFDAGGVWLENPFQFIPDQSADIPGASYSSSISANLSAINAIISAGVADIPEPGSTMAIISAGILAMRRRK